MTPIPSPHVTMTEALPSWRDGAAKSGARVPRGIADRVAAGGIAVFESRGTSVRWQIRRHSV
jgi:hypothetical protein